MKNLKNKVISCALAAVTVFGVSTAFKKYAPLTASAATNEQFLSDIALVYEDSVEDAQAAIAGTDWKLYNKDLNPNADYMFDDGVYLIYKTSTNVEDAITDLRVMDMYGGYATTNYQKQLENSRNQYMQAIADLRKATDEFKTLYNAGDDMAELAYRQMNYYKDVRTENGTETDMKMGDFFLNMPTDDKIVQVMMEGNSVVVSNLISLLAVGISGASGTTLATRIAEKYAIKDTLTDEEYHEDAKSLATSFETIKAKLIRFDALKEEYNFEDDDMTEEEYVFLTEYATIADLMTIIQFGETTLADFIKGTWTTKDLYPIVAAFTPGQKALVGMGQIETVLKYSSPSKPIEELTKAVEEVEKEIKDENGNLKVFDVYAGVDREIFKGDFAMTTEAERQQALTGKTWDMSDATSRSVGMTVGYIISGVVDLAIAGTAAGIAIKTAVLKSSIATAGAALKKVAAINRVSSIAVEKAATEKALATFTAKWGAIQTPMAVVAIAFALILAGGYGLATWYNYYNPDYLEIPTTLIDVKETDLGDKYVKYNAAKVFNGEEGQEVADFNAYEGKEWIALYYTKDATAGNCLTPNFVYRENNNTVSKRHQGISMFGEDNAFNLNSHVYNDDAAGIYLTVRYSTTKKAAADMPTVVIYSLLSRSVTEEFSTKLFSVLVEKKRVYCPIFLRHEGLDLILALCDDSRCYRLNSSCGKTALNALPKKLGKVKSDESVENSSCLLRVNKLFIYSTGGFDSFLYRTLCYFVKGYSARSLRRNPELRRDVPGNGLTLTVRVRREKDLCCLLCFGSELFDNVALASDVYIMRLETVFDVDAERAFWEIPDMTLRCNNLVVGTKIALDCISLCG